MPCRKVLPGVLAAGLLQIVLMGSAAAQLEKGAYFGLEGGMAWTANITYTTGYTGCYPPYYCSYPTYYNAVTYDLGYSAGLQMGYSFGGPRLEFEYNYRNNGASTIATAGGTQSASGSLSSSAYMVNLLYDFDTRSKWVPYVGLGMGAANVRASNIHSNNTSVDGSFLNGGNTEFAAQFILGTEYRVSDKLGITIDWRGLWATDAKFDYGIGCKAGGTGACAQTGVMSYNYWNGALNLGLRFKF